MHTLLVTNTSWQFPVLAPTLCCWVMKFLCIFSAGRGDWKIKILQFNSSVPSNKGEWWHRTLVLYCRRVNTIQYSNPVWSRIFHLYSVFFYFIFLFTALKARVNLIKHCFMFNFHVDVLLRKLQWFITRNSCVKIWILCVNKCWRVLFMREGIYNWIYKLQRYFIKLAVIPGDIKSSWFN